jgi:glucose-1-phosphate adenylyltransferase
MNPTEARYVSRLTRETLALVLAGGRGSRLGPLTDWRAKPAVPFGGKFRIIDFPLSNCINSGIRRIAVLTQYKSHSLIRHIQKGWGFLREFNEFLELLPAQQRISETAWYAGTADAVYQNIDIIRHHAPGYVLIVAGDHIYKMDYGPMLAAHVENEVDVTVGCIGVPKSQARSFGVMQVDEKRRIVKFEEKPHNPQALPGKPDTVLASMGIYIFNTKFLIEELVRDAARSDSNHDFGKDIIPGAIGRLPVLAYSFQDVHGTGQGYWRDVGTVDAYWQANIELIEVAPELNLYDRLADLDVPGAAAAGQVRVRRPRPSRDRGQLDGLGRLHRRRLHAHALAGLLQRDHRDPFAGRRVGLAAQCAGRAQLQDPPRDHRQGMPDPRRERHRLRPRI